MLQKMCSPPISLPGEVGSFRTLHGNRLPPLPWGICTGFSYECGHCCSNQNYGIDGDISLWNGWELPLNETIYICFVNLLLLANPTVASKKHIPENLQDDLVLKKHTRSYNVEFTLKEIISWLEYHWIYFSRRQPRSIDRRKMIEAALKQAANKELISIRYGGKILFYTLISIGRSRIL